MIQVMVWWSSLVRRPGIGSRLYGAVKHEHKAINAAGIASIVIGENWLSLPGNRNVQFCSKKHSLEGISIVQKAVPKELGQAVWQAIAYRGPCCRGLSISPDARLGQIGLEQFFGLDITAALSLAQASDLEAKMLRSCCSRLPARLQGLARPRNITARPSFRTRSLATVAPPAARVCQSLLPSPAPSSPTMLTRNTSGTHGA